MTIDDQVIDKKLKYNINWEAAKISLLRKIDEYGYLTGKEWLPSNQKQIIEQVKFIYFLLGKAFDKVKKTFENQGQKQVKAIEDNKKQPDNNNKIDYKSKLLISKEEKYLKIFIMKE